LLVPELGNRELHLLDLQGTSPRFGFEIARLRFRGGERHLAG